MAKGHLVFEGIAFTPTDQETLRLLLEDPRLLRRAPLAERAHVTEDAAKKRLHHLRDQTGTKDVWNLMAWIWQRREGLQRALGQSRDVSEAGRSSTPVRGPGTSVTALDPRVSELQRMREQLVDVVADVPTTFLDDVIYTYTVALDRRDLIRMEFSTMVRDPESLPWRSLRFGVGQASASLESFADLQLEVKADYGRVFVIPTDVTLRQVRVGVFFMPPISSREEKRRWSIAYQWTGIWDELREQGEDRVEFVLSGRTRSRENVVILPAGALGAEIIPVTPPNAETWMEGTPTGEIALHWRITNPNVGEYRFAVRGRLPRN